jgi:predicted membrane channel-forming protein YqfA (hemolysin III family)
MFSIICGAALIAISSASFWHLLPRKGQVHPLVNKFDGGSMIMIVILTSFTVGALLMAASFIG